MARTVRVGPNGRTRRRTFLVGTGISALAIALSLGPIVVLADTAARGIPGVDSPDRIPWVRIGRAALRTLLQASISTAVAIVVGLAIGWVLAGVSASVARALRAVVLVPFVLPSVVAAAGVLAAGRPWLPKGGSLLAVVAAHGWMNAGFVAVLVAPALSMSTSNAAQAARTLGASEVRVYRTIVWPAVQQRLCDAGLIVFSLCSVAFATVLILGGPQHATVDVEIWYSVNQMLDLRSAAVMAALQAVVMLGLVWMRVRGGGDARQRLYLRRDTDGQRAVRPSLGARIGAALVVFVALAPVAALLVRAWGGAGSRIRPAAAGIELASGTGPMLLRSLAVSAAVALFAGLLALGCVAAYRVGAGNLAERMLLIPLGLSAASTGLGWYLIGQRVGLAGSWVLVVAAQGTLAAPFTVSAALGAARAIRPAAEDAAATLGASPGKVFRTIAWPNLWPALLAGSTLAAAIALGDLGAASFVVPGDQPTLAMFAAQLLGRPVPGSFEAGLRWSLLLGGAAAVIAALGTVGRSLKRRRQLSGRDLLR